VTGGWILESHGQRLHVKTLVLPVLAVVGLIAWWLTKRLLEPRSLSLLPASATSDGLVAAWRRAGVL
jgi:hypothetical protein